MPAVAGDRAITSAVLHEGTPDPAHDRVALYVLGELVSTFDVPAGAGERVLRECGLVPATELAGNSGGGEGG